MFTNLKDFKESLDLGQAVEIAKFEVYSNQRHVSLDENGHPYINDGDENQWQVEPHRLQGIPRKAKKVYSNHVVFEDGGRLDFGAAKEWSFQDGYATHAQDTGDSGIRITYKAAQ